LGPPSYITARHLLALGWHYLTIHMHIVSFSFKVVEEGFDFFAPNYRFNLQFVVNVVLCCTELHTPTLYLQQNSVNLTPVGLGRR